MFDATKFVCTTVAAVAILTLGMVDAHAAIVYDNSTYDLGYGWRTSSGQAFGDDVTLAGTARQVMNLSVLLWAETAQTSDVGLALYDGADGSQLWSGVVANFDVLGDTWLTMPVPNVAVPDAIIWTALMSNLEVRLRLFDPPTVGASDDLFWVNDAGTWHAFWFNGDPVANFAATIEAVPEPATLCLLGAGVAGLMTRRLRRK